MKGFTLIELLVVVLIIGILSSVALPKYERAVKRARAARLLPLIKDVQNAQEVYFLANGQYASCINELELDWPDFKVQREVSGCVDFISKGNGIDKITLHRAGGGPKFAVYMGNYGVTGYGGYGFSLAGDKKLVLSCAEYSCHSVEEGSFCHDVLGTTKTAQDGWCMRLFDLP